MVVQWKVDTAVATAAMAVSMLSLYAVSTIAPFLVTDLSLSRAAVGGLVTGTFAVAAGVSLVVGQLVDVMGARRGLLYLAAAVGLALVAASAAPSYGWLLAALAVSGVAQALANPATNVLIAERVPPHQRGFAVGVKQSGVQLAAFACGLVLPALAAVAGWRHGLQFAALAAAVLLVVVWWLVPAKARSASAGGPWWRLSSWPAPWLVAVMGYSLLLGTGLSAMTTYLPLYTTQRLELGPWAAGAVLAVFGASGLVGRVWWTRWADRLAEVTAALVWLSAVAAVFVALVWLAEPLWSGLVLLGAVGVGGSAVAANAVSMLAVLRRGGATGHASGLVSLGFFGGFVLGPTSFGLLADRAGYHWAWIAVGLVFTVAAVVAAVFLTRWRRPVSTP